MTQEIESQLRSLADAARAFLDHVDPCNVTLLHCEEVEQKYVELRSQIGKANELLGETPAPRAPEPAPIGLRAKNADDS